MSSATYLARAEGRRSAPPGPPSMQKKAATATGPMRPTYMQPTTNHCAGSGRSSVTPVDSPTTAVADTASIGSVMIPQMIKNGYPRLFAVNVTISGSLQPLLIPPSHNAVIYSLAAGGTVSVAHLFIAGVIPGLLLGLSLMAICLIIAHRRGFPKGAAIGPRQV